MMQKKITFISLIFLMNLCFSQSKKTCSSPDKSEDDFLSISKCEIKSKRNGKEERQISFRVYRRVRKVPKPMLRKKIGEGVGVKANSLEKISSTEIQIPEVKLNLAKRISAEEIAKSVPLTAIKNIPLFPKCVNKKQKEYVSCFNNELANHVQKNLRFPYEAEINHVQGDVWVRFIIDKNGEITNIQARGPKGTKSLEYEAKLVVAKLPKFSPAKFNNEPISVRFAFPISFKLEE